MESTSLSTGSLRRPHQSCTSTIRLRIIKFVCLVFSKNFLLWVEVELIQLGRGGNIIRQYKKSILFSYLKERKLDL